MWNNVEMKKINNLNNHHVQEAQEKAKKIYRLISDRVKILDDARGCANQIRDLFLPAIQIHRSKLQEYSERLIFAEPLLFGLKAEELLWRKAYYDVIATAKRLKKLEYNVEEKSAMINHINAGIGHYHHYISRLQTDFEVSYDKAFDFYIINNTNAETSVELQEWVLSSIHRSLIYLGDLCRYKLEIYPNWDPNLAIRYYSQALLLKPDYGMPHNQMGTLASSLNQQLDGTYHYVQCIMSKHPFEGSENNLHRLFEKNAQYLEQLPVDAPQDGTTDCIIQLEPTEQVRLFVARFLLLADVWFFNKKIPHIYDLCHQTNVDLQECLSLMRPIASDSGGSQNGDNTDTESVTSTAFLTSDMIFKMIVICLQCITKLQRTNNSHQLSNVIAFTLAVYSQLVQHITSRIQESILNFPLQESKKIKKKLFMRRRKKLPANSDDESDSEIELDESQSEEDDEEGRSPIDLPVSSSSSDEDDDDDDEDIVIEEDEETKRSKDVMREVIGKMRQIDVKDMLDILSEEMYLQSVKILSNWLQTDIDVLRSCGKSTRSLFVQLAYLFNLINIDYRKLKCAQKLDTAAVPLSEDVLLKGMEVISDGGQAGLEWERFARSTIRTEDEVIIRIKRIVAFGRFLATHPATGVAYDEKTRYFSVDKHGGIDEDVSPTTIEDLEAYDAAVENASNSTNSSNNLGGGAASSSNVIANATAATPAAAATNNNNNNGTNTKMNKHERETKRQLMKHMGQLWLAAEVRDLESRVKGKMSLSPYLVVDVDALIKHMAMVKHLVYSRKFLILVPTAVLCALDDQKKIKSEAREAIRWLESQFRQGNRFFRPQRHQEKLPLPLIKYPKKKDKEAHVYIQIIECCHYLAEQEKNGSNMVTLLVGEASALQANEAREVSYVGLAQSAGVNIELISEFYAKWKKSASKSKGR